MERYQNGSLVLAWAFMLVANPHMLLTLHLSLIQGLATSHLNSTLSSMMILPRCHIFALARSHRIGRTLYVPLPQFRCILKSKLEPGNQFRTWKQRKETSQANLKLYPLPIKIVREGETVLHNLITAKNRYLLRMSRELIQRSITQLLLQTVPTINGICHHQSILKPVDCVACLELKFLPDAVWCIPTRHSWIKTKARQNLNLHTCNRQANKVLISNLPWCYSQLSVPLDMDCHAWLTLYRKKYP